MGSPWLTHRRAVGLMVLVTLMWSIAGVVTRQLEHARSFEVTFWRSFFTVLALLVILPLWRGPQVFRNLPWRSGAFWISSACWSVMFTAFMVALTLTTVGNVLVTMAIGPLLTALMARFFISHRLATRTWVAIAVAGAGIAYMFGAQMNLAEPGALLGCLVALWVPIAAATHWTVVQRQHMLHAVSDAAPNAAANQAPNVAVNPEPNTAAKSAPNVPAAKPPADLVPCVLVGAMISCLVTLPLALPFVASSRDIAWLALLGTVQLAIPCTLSVVCARVLKAPEVSLLALLETIFGIGLAWLGAGEVPSQTVLLGGALVIGALLANELLGWRATSAAK